MKPEDHISGPGLRGLAREAGQTKEVFEMAASRFIEEESGTYSGRIRHAHSGYYAGDFSRVPRTGSRLSAAYTSGRVVRRTQAQAQTSRPQAAQLVPGGAIPVT